MAGGEGLPISQDMGSNKLTLFYRNAHGVDCSLRSALVTELPSLSVTSS